jgi:hypothetical protein
MDPGSLLDTSHFNLTGSMASSGMAPGKVRRATYGESILEREKC